MRRIVTKKTCELGLKHREPNTKQKGRQGFILPTFTSYCIMPRLCVALLYRLTEAMKHRRNFSAGGNTCRVEDASGLACNHTCAYHGRYRFCGIVRYVIRINKYYILQGLLYVDGDYSFVPVPDDDPINKLFEKNLYISRPN